MRGPGISPSAIAILNPCGEPPASRTAVKPESSVRSAFFAAWNNWRLTGNRGRSCTGATFP
jgi:hypothetical protein